MKFIILIPFRRQILNCLILTMLVCLLTPAHADNGSLTSWGRDRFGEVSNTPNDSGYTAIAAGQYFTLALKADGSIVGWGNKFHNGILSDIPAAAGHTAITAGRVHALALRADGSIVGWGNDDSGQISNIPVDSGYTAIAAGWGFSLALQADGTIVSWGNDYAGLVKDTPQDNGYIAIAAGDLHALALRTDGTIKSWGWNQYGQTSDTPTNSGYTAITAGYHHSLALRTDGLIVGWGREQFGTISQIPGDSGYTAIAAAELHSLALRADGSIVSWGYDGSGQISDTPAGKGFTGIAAGQRQSVAIHPGTDDDLIRIEKLINNRAREDANNSAQLLVGTQYRTTYRVTNNSPHKLYRVRVYEQGEFVCNLYTLDAGETKSRHRCARNETVQVDSHNVNATVTARISGTNRTISADTDAYYTGHSNVSGQLSVTHFVNNSNADTVADAITTTSNRVEILFRVENTGPIELYRVKTYHDPVNPVNSGWQEKCLIGSLMPGQVRYCKRTISVDKQGLNLAIGRAQGVNANVSNTGIVNAANPSYFNVKFPIAVTDPERNSIDTTGWGWQTGVTASHLGNHLKLHSERLVDIDRTGPDSYDSAQVTNSGSTYATPAFWFTGLDEAGVIKAIADTNGRIIDVDPYVESGKTTFTVSIIPNKGKAAKSWWWGFGKTAQQVLDAINQNNMRLIDIEAYTLNNTTVYAFVGIQNTGIDTSDWWFYFNADMDTISRTLRDNGARLIDLEIRQDGLLAAIMVKNDGRHWWWGVGYSAQRVGEFVDNKGSRIVDIESYKSGGSTRYAFISIDNVATEEARRLRPIMEKTYDAKEMGNNVTRGFLVKESNGSMIAEIGSGLSFQPASTLKLLPYLYAMQETDSRYASLSSQLRVFRHPDNWRADCTGTRQFINVTFKDALPTMMWYSHNPTLDALFNQYYPAYNSNALLDTLTRRAQHQWGMPNTIIFSGCNGEWLDNRSTLRDIATLYEGVDSGRYFANKNTQALFWNNMINHMHADCKTNPVGTGNCTCPSYYPQCPGNFYQSPYAGDAPDDTDDLIDFSGPANLLFIRSIVQQEGGNNFPVDAFLDEVIMRKKGGGASVPVRKEGYGSGSFFVTLPFKNHLNQVSPRSFVVTWFMNGWDPTCGGLADIDCKNIRDEDGPDISKLERELFRVPIRMAVNTWKM